MANEITASEVLERFKNEELPEFCRVNLNSVNKKGIFGNYPLHVACVRGDVVEVQALLIGGAKINAQGELNNTALHDATGQENLTIVELLLESGSSTHQKNDFNQTALDIAILKKNKSLIEILSK